MSKKNFDLSQILEANSNAAEKIREFTTGLDFDDFAGDLKAVRGVMFDLVIVGEACHDIEQLYPDIATRHPQLPIRQAYSLRNRLVHVYLD